MRAVRCVVPQAVAALAVATLAVAALALAGCASPEDKAARHVAKAKEYAAAEDYQRATLEAKSAVQLQPKNAEAHLILAKAAWRDGDYGKAFPSLQMAVEGDPNLVEARLRLGDLYLASRDPKSAMEQLDALRKIEPDSPEVRLLAGRILISQGDNVAGAAEIDAALAANPVLVDALNIKAGLLSGQGRNAEALAVLDEGIARAGPGEAQTLQEFRLRFLAATGQAKAYEESLKALIKQFPDHHAYRNNLVAFYGQQGRTAEQEAALRDLLGADPKNANVTVRLAGFLSTRGDGAGAEKLLRDSIEANPESAEVKLALGDLFRSQKRGAEAMAVYQAAADKWPATSAEGQEARNRVVAQHAVDGDIKAARAGIAGILEAAPDNAEALLNRATFAFLDREYESAIADLRTALRREKSPEALLLLARSYVGLGDNVVAKDTYRRLVEDYPGHPEGAKELAVLLSGQGDSAAAEEILRRFIAIRPDDPEASAVLVNTLLARRDVAAAEAEARRMVETGVGGLAADQAFGAVLQAGGSPEEALARYKAVLAEDPNQFAALDGLVEALLATNRPGEAIEFLEKYPRGDLAPSLLLGKVFSRQGDMAAARQVLEQAITANPADARPYLALATLVPEGSAEQMEILQRGWTESPGDPTLGLFLASFADRQGKPEEAIAIYEEIERQGRSSLAVTNNLASLLLDHRSEKKDLARALDLAKRLAGSDDPISLDTLGWAYYRNGDIPNAVRQLERAVGRNGDDPLLQYHLGKAYVAASNPVSARQHLERAIEGGGDAPYVADARKALASLGS